MARNRVAQAARLTAEWNRSPRCEGIRFARIFNSKRARQANLPDDSVYMWRVYENLYLQSSSLIYSVYEVWK